MTDDHGRASGVESDESGSLCLRVEQRVQRACGQLARLLSGVEHLQVSLPELVIGLKQRGSVRIVDNGDDFTNLCAAVCVGGVNGPPRMKRRVSRLELVRCSLKASLG